MEETGACLRRGNLGLQRSPGLRGLAVRTAPAPPLLQAQRQLLLARGLHDDAMQNELKAMQKKVVRQLLRGGRSIT